LYLLAASPPSTGLTGAIGRPSRPLRRLVGILGSTSLKVAASTPPEDRPDHFAIRNGLVRRRAFDRQSGRAKRRDDIDQIEAALRRCVEASHATLVRMHLHHSSGTTYRAACQQILEADLQVAAFALPLIAEIATKAKP
jgi:hypothetical protein